MRAPLSLHRTALLVAALVLAPAAFGQNSCALPKTIKPAAPKTYKDANSKAPVDYHAFVLSWSPQHCHAIRQKAKTDPTVMDAHRHQCDSTNRFEWVVHGLWPQNAAAKQVSDHPRACKDSPSLKEELLKKHLCTLPGEDLMQNEWQAHGTCAWKTPDSYFETIETVWAGLKKPTVAQTHGSQQPRDGAVASTPADIKNAWVSANQGRLTQEMLRVNVASGNFLKEIWVCMDKAFKPTACAKGGTPDQQAIRVRLPTP